LFECATWVLVSCSVGVGGAIPPPLLPCGGLAAWCTTRRCSALPPCVRMPAIRRELLNVPAAAATSDRSIASVNLVTLLTSLEGAWRARVCTAATRTSGHGGLLARLL
jgi:hypothetical protein